MAMKAASTPCARNWGRWRSSPRTGVPRTWRGLGSASTMPTISQEGWAKRRVSMMTLACPPPPTRTRRRGVSSAIDRAVAMASDIGVDHFADHRLDADRRLPLKEPLGLRRITDQAIDFGGSEVLRIDLDVILVVQTDMAEGHFAHGAHRGGPPAGDHEVFRLVLLQHQPHGPDVVLGVTPVTLGLEIPKL